MPRKRRNHPAELEADSFLAESRHQATLLLVVMVLASLLTLLFLGKKSLSGLLGLVVYALVLIPVLISALNALKLEAITQPASAMLDQILSNDTSMMEFHADILASELEA